MPENILTKIVATINEKISNPNLPGTLTNAAYIEGLETARDAVEKIIKESQDKDTQKAGTSKKPR